MRSLAKPSGTWADSRWLCLLEPDRRRLDGARISSAELVQSIHRSKRSRADARSIGAVRHTRETKLASRIRGRSCASVGRLGAYASVNRLAMTLSRFRAAADEKSKIINSKSLRQEYEFRDRRDRLNDRHGSATVPLHEGALHFMRVHFK